jgi:hypothetical protein
MTEIEIRKAKSGGNQPFLTWIAPKGQAGTHVPQPTHILIESNIGDSYRSSCSRSLRVHERAAAQAPVSPLQERGSQRSKSMLAHLFTHGLPDRPYCYKDYHGSSTCQVYYI